MSEQRAKNVPLGSADVLVGGRSHDKPKECLLKRLQVDVGFFCFFLENVDELESEGVSNLHSTGARLSKVTESFH